MNIQEWKTSVTHFYRTHRVILNIIVWWATAFAAYILICHATNNNYRLM